MAVKIFFVYYLLKKLNYKLCLLKHNMYIAILKF